MQMVSRPLKQAPPRISEEANHLFKTAQTLPPAANARIAASIWDGNLYLDDGYNSLKTHPFQKKYGKNENCIHLHAEINAICNATRTLASGSLKGCTMVVVRAKKASPRGPWVWGMARPCEGCQRAIVAFGIKNVWYSTNETGVLECL